MYPLETGGGYILPTDKLTERGRKSRTSFFEPRVIQSRWHRLKSRKWAARSFEVARRWQQQERVCPLAWRRCCLMVFYICLIQQNLFKSEGMKTMAAMTIRNHYTTENEELPDESRLAAGDPSTITRVIE